MRAAGDSVEVDTTSLTAGRGHRADRRARPGAGPRMSRTPRVAVVGFPNVGKSTLVNRLSGGREAVVHSEAGVTRDRKELPCEWNGRDFILIDTGGLDFEAGDQISRAIQEQARAAIADADVVALVLDAKAGPAPGRRRGRRDPAPLGRSRGGRREQGRRPIRRAAGRRPLQPRAGRARWASRPRRAARRGTSWTGWSLRCPRPTPMPRTSPIAPASR